MLKINISFSKKRGPHFFQNNTSLLEITFYKNRNAFSLNKKITTTIKKIKIICYFFHFLRIGKISIPSGAFYTNKFTF